MNQFGERMHELMKANGISIEDLCSDTGINYHSAAAYRAGKRMPGSGNLRKLAAELKTSVAYLMGETDDPGERETEPDNVYWHNICLIAGKQRAKGIRTYGQGIEYNRLDVVARLDYLEEELIDGLMYIEWIKEGLKDVVSRDQFNRCFDECMQLRIQNEQLMDALREKGDDGK